MNSSKIKLAADLQWIENDFCVTDEKMIEILCF